jgi:preprotein translocase subunit SecB
VFSLFDGDDQSKLNAFARGQAPVLLLPYLRAVISSITAQSRMGAIVLPPINMVQIIERMQSSTEIEQATR